MKYFYRGKPIEELTREELEIAYGQAVDWSRIMLKSQEESIGFGKMLDEVELRQLSKGKSMKDKYTIFGI